MSEQRQSIPSHYPDIHPVTAAAFEEISGAHYPRDAKRVARRAGRLVTEHRIPLAEMEAVIAAGARKVHELSPHEPAEPEEIPVSEAIPATRPLTNEEILAKIPAREPDWFERGLPNGDRD